MTLPSKIMMKPFAAFLACMVGAATLCLGGYAFTVDRLVQKTDMPATYKWFLLKHVPGPRLIIESGSNSHHALDTDMIGEAIGMTAINIADNGGYALEDKITRLETYTRAGDIVVLPLEWTFYHREQLTDNYVETLFTDNRDYYRSMPLYKKAKRALSLPPEKVFAEIYKVKDRPEQQKESPAQDLFLAALTQSTGHQSRAKSIGPGPGVAEQSCDDYILGKAMQRQQLKLVENIRPNLVRLQKLKLRGVKIHFAWPVMVGDGCMTDPIYFSGFGKEIEDTVNQAGFQFLGSPSQSLYHQEYRDDTPYHLITRGTKQHTKRMIGYLKAQGYKQSGSPLDIKSFAQHRLLEMELANELPHSQPTLPIGELIKMDVPEQRRYIDFNAGWWGFEPYGRWMRDNRAMFRVTLPADMPENAVLKIQGVTKSGRAEQVTLSIGGIVVSSGLFGNDKPLVLATRGLPREEALSIFLTLPNAGPAQSPLERGENQDARTMTLHIQSIILSSSVPEPEPETTRLVSEDESNLLDAALNVENTILPLTFNPPLVSADFGGECSPLNELFFTKQQPIEFDEGWWPQETTGRWMKTQKATFKLNLPLKDSKQTENSYRLKIKGDFFQGQPRSMSVSINGQKTQAFKPSRDGSLVAFFDTPRKTRTIDVTLLLAGDTPQSPKALGISMDERTLTYFLKSAELVPA